MKLHEAIAILKTYNAWRLGANIEQLPTEIVTEAINMAIVFCDDMSKLRKRKKPSILLCECAFAQPIAMVDENGLHEFCQKCHRKML
jgi:hypothetical protein